MQDINHTIPSAMLLFSFLTSNSNLTPLRFGRESIFNCSYVQPQLMSRSRNQRIIDSTDSPFSAFVRPFHRFSFLWLIAPLPLSALHIAPLDTLAPTTPCVGGGGKRSGSTKELAAINFAQATFTIMRRDSRLIALTPSPRRACPSPRSPFSVNTKEPSHFAFIRGAERKELEGECVWTLGFLLFSTPFFTILIFTFLRVVITILYRKIKRRVSEGYRWLGFIFLFTFSSELQLAGGRHFGTKAAKWVVVCPEDGLC